MRSIRTIRTNGRNVDAWVEVSAPNPRAALQHELDHALTAFARYRTRKALEASEVFSKHSREVDRVLRGFEWDFTSTVSPRAKQGGAIRAVAWNVERGKRFRPLLHTLEHHPTLREADLLLLSELDIGMGRSDNRNVPRELAEGLGYHYVFANFHLVLCSGDYGEQACVTPNASGMHGIACLSRFPIRRFAALGLPEYRDKFEVLEKRLGTKRALFCEVDLPDGPVTVVCLHLDPFCGPAHRAMQARAIATELARFGGERVLIGGDFNTHTYNLAGPAGLAFDVFHKLARFGFAGTVREYLTPERLFEREVFSAFKAAGIEFEGFTDPACGTINYDLSDPEVVGKSLDEVPKPVLRWLHRKLEPWNGCVPLRFDWFGGRNLQAVRCETVRKPRHEGVHVSDHDPVVVDFLPVSKP